VVQDVGNYPINNPLWVEKRMNKSLMSVTRFTGGGETGVAMGFNSIYKGAAKPEIRTEKS